MTCIENGINCHNSESMQVLQRLCSTLKGSYLSQIHCLTDEQFQTVLCSKFIPKLSRKREGSKHCLLTVEITVPNIGLQMSHCRYF